MAISTIDNNGVNLGQLGNRNMVTNGSMAVAQRSVSETGLSGTNSYKTVDRYTTYISSLGTWTQSQDTDAPSGFGYSLKMLCTTADASPASTNRMLIQTKIEGQDIQSLGFGDTSNTYTVSFYVKSNVTGTYILEHLGGNASATLNKISTSYTVDTANTWERKTITLNVDSGAMTSDNTSGLILSFWLGTGSNYSSGTLNTSWSASGSVNRAVGQVNLASATNNYWQITGVQLEVGDTATPFEHRSYGDELAKCQRYYFQRNYTVNTYEPIKFPCWIGATSNMTGEFVHPVPMRATPSLSNNGVGNFRVNDSLGGDQVCNTITRTGGREYETFITFGKITANLSVGNCGYINTEVNNDATLYFDAEL